MIHVRVAVAGSINIVAEGYNGRLYRRFAIFKILWKICINVTTINERLNIMHKDNKRLLKSVLLILSVFWVYLSPSIVKGQNSIEGIVANKITGEVLWNVNISVQGTKLGAASDPNGYFVINKVPVGVYTLKFSSIGYEELEFKDVKIEIGKTATLNVSLYPTILEAQEIVVTGTRSIHSLKNVPVETNLISARELKGIGLQTLTDAVRWVSGIDISGGAPNGAARRFTAMIHGLPSQYSMILVDGERAKSEHIHTGTNLNLVPMCMIERIEVVKGPASALYGSEAFGGVINIITKPLPEKSIYGAEISYGEYNTQNINLNHGSSIGKFGYYINGNLMRTDGVPDANAIKLDYNQTNLLGKLSYKVSKNNILKFNTRYYDNKYLRKPTLPKVKDRWINISGQWESILSDKSSITTGLSYSHFKGEYRDDDNRTTMADVVYKGEFNNNNVITTGVEIRNEQFSRTATPQKETTIVGGFIKDEVRLTAPLTYITALRIDNHPNIGTEFTPKFGVLYRLTMDTDIRASVGKGFRAPSLQDLYEKEFDHRTYYRNGNPDLKPEYSMSCNLGIEHRFNDFVVMRISGFGNDFKNMIMALDTGESLNGKPIFRRENIKNASAQGVETEIRFKIGSLNAMLSYTYSDTQDDDGNPLAYSPESMTVLRLYHYAQRLSLGAMLSVEDAGNRHYKTSGAPDKLKDYTLVNLSVNKKLVDNLIIFFRVENLFDQEFEIYEDGKSLAGYGRSLLGGIKFDY